MKQEVRNVGKVSASTPSSGSNYLLYSSVESIKIVLNKYTVVLHCSITLGKTCKTEQTKLK